MPLLPAEHAFAVLIDEQIGLVGIERVRGRARSRLRPINTLGFGLAAKRSLQCFQFDELREPPNNVIKPAPSASSLSSERIVFFSGGFG